MRLAAPSFGKIHLTESRALPNCSGIIPLAGTILAMKPGQLAAYLFLAVAWGFSFMLVLHTVGAFGWVGAVSLRCFIASITLYLVAKAIGRHLDFSAGWRAFAMVGATTVAGQLIGLSYATPLIGTAMAAILVASIPLFSMLIGQFWGWRRYPRSRFSVLLSVSSASLSWWASLPFRSLKHSCSAAFPACSAASAPPSAAIMPAAT